MRPAEDVEAIRKALFVFFDGLRDLRFTRLHLFGDIQGLVALLPGWSPLLHYHQHPEPGLLTVHVGLNYSGQAEIETIARAARQECRELGAAPLETLLLSSGVPAVDFVFRAGGQQRLSGFLPFQTAYAELWFTSSLWPDVTRKEFERSLSWYAQQERRLGE